MWMDVALDDLKHAGKYLIIMSKKEPCRSTFKCSFARTLTNAKYQPSPGRFGRYWTTRLNVGSVFLTQQGVKTNEKEGISLLLGNA